MVNKGVTLFFLFLFLIGCKTIEKVSEKENITSLSEREILKNVRDFESRKNINSVFFSRTSVSFTSDDKNQNFRCNVFLYVDSFIRISVLAPMGIEAARISLEEDGVIIIDRINRQVVYSGYDELYRKYRINLDLYFLQNVLLNKPFDFTDSLGTDIDDYYYRGIENSLYKFSSTKERHVKSTNNRKYSEVPVFHQLWILPEDFYLMRNFLHFGAQDVDLDILYEDFTREFSGFYFPSSVVMKGQFGDKKFSLKAKFGNIRFNDVNGISFSIPEKYDKIYR
ncbi:DUF4292 domain-containing protein [Anaerophaga thermohalophila]|uniref:DUF4292 domain-containing protein n=1 Tax=Anaerophaga thermohalophila TaxID=177400 RepID=UPI000237C870|nr:DUF4292 domain-containing protein [Anaerophaga thermohalophila]